MGEKYINAFLAHGGGKHPAELVEGICFSPFFFICTINECEAMNSLRRRNNFILGLLGQKPTTEMLVNSLMEDIEES